MLVPRYDNFANFGLFGTQARLRGRPAGQLPGALRHLWNIRGNGTTKPGLPHAKQFLKKLSPQFWHAPFKMFRQP